MAHFFRNGNMFRVADDKAVEVHEKLPAGNYIVKMDPFENFFLQEVDSYSQVKKLYGNTTRYAERIMNTFLDREHSTGVLLNGEKGSGKTLLAKTLSINGAEIGIPTITINNAWVGDDFSKLIQDIEQPAILLFDEFEKVYDEKAQEYILTLLDGVFPTKKLFVLTCNDKWRINTHMRNRPGRLFYMLDFHGLEPDFIREYCEDNLNAKEHIEKIINIASLFDQFNFDMLKAMCEEMNRYGDTPTDVVKMLNVKPEYGGDVKYDVELIYNGKKVERMHPSVWKGNPLSEEVRLGFHYSSGKPTASVPEQPTLLASEDELDEEDGYVEKQFTTAHLYQVLPQEGKFMYRDEKGNHLTLTRKVEHFYDWRAF